MGQALIGAALNRKQGACRVAKPRKAEGNIQYFSEQTPRLHLATYKNLILFLS